MGDLDLHWEFPEGDLERDGCRSMAVSPDADPAKGSPFCYYQADPSKPQSQWLWEKCDIPICEITCNRPGLGNDTSLPPCQEYVEDNPRMQAVVSHLARRLLASLHHPSAGNVWKFPFIPDRRAVQAGVDITSQDREYQCGRWKPRFLENHRTGW